MEIKRLSIKEDFIRLDSAMKLAGIVSTGGHAKTVIQNGEVKVNGEVRELSGKEYTCSDDDNCTRVNLYNQWVTSIPDDSRCADGDKSGLSATLLSVKDNEILSTLEITFTYSAP